VAQLDIVKPPPRKKGEQAEAGRLAKFQTTGPATAAELEVGGVHRRPPTGNRAALGSCGANQRVEMPASARHMTVHRLKLSNFHAEVPVIACDGR
jgi:hypothetical protein